MQRGKPMTNELEKTFFDTFGIEPKQTCKVTSTCNNYVNYNDCNGCNSYKYPQISDRILLELICIISLNPISVLFEPMLGEFKEVELLKKIYTTYLYC